MKKILTFICTLLFLCIIGCNLSQPEMKFTTVKGLNIIDWATLNDDGSLIVFGNGHMRGITLYDTQSQTSHNIWDSEGENAKGATFHPLNSNYVACCNREKIVLVNWKEKKILFQLSIEQGYTQGIAFSEDGSQIYVVHSFFPEDKTLPDWDIDKMGTYCVSEILKIDVESQTIVEKIIVDNKIIQGVDFNSNRNRVALRYMGGQADIWDLNKKICIQSVRHLHGDNCVIFIDEKTFLTDGNNYPGDIGDMDSGNVALWEIDTGKPIKKFKIHRMRLEGMGIIYDKNGNKYILSGSEDRQAKLWSLDTGKVLWSKRYGFDVTVAASGDGRRGVIRTEKDPVIVDFNF